VAQRLVEAEGVNQHPPPAAPESRRDLSRQERGGRAGDEHLGAVGIQQPTDEAFPAGDDLNLVEVPDYRRRVIQVGDGAAVLGDEQVEVRGVQIRKPLVLEREVGQPLPGEPLLDALLAELVQERGLAGPAHPHHGCDLPRERHLAEDPATREIGQRLLRGVGQLLA